MFSLRKLEFSRKSKMHCSEQLRRVSSRSESFRYSTSKVLEGWLLKDHEKWWSSRSKLRFCTLQGQTLTITKDPKTHDSNQKRHYYLKEATISTIESRLQIKIRFNVQVFSKKTMSYHNTVQVLSLKALSTNDYRVWLDAFQNAKGQTIKQYYAKLRQIGSGTFGNVYLAIDRNSREKVAVKVLQTLHDSTAEAHAAKEVQILKSLEHPNVIRVLDVFEQDNKQFIVMEYAAGGTLEDYLRRNPRRMPERLVKAIIQKILLGIQYLHSKQIVHRDLKTQNVVCMSKMNPVDLKITDFGLSTFNRSSVIGLFSNVGTPHYVAPEVLTSEYGSKADIWSVGVIMYYLLFRKMPFDANTVSQTLLQVAEGTVNLENEFWDTMPIAHQFLTGLLAKDPFQRMSATEALEHPWLTCPHEK